MRFVTLELLRAAYGRYALGAFNVCNMEQIHGLFRGAAKARAPIIVQFTRVIRNYADPAMLAAMIQAAEEIHPEVDFAVHLDHGDEASCSEAIRSGHYGSVMIDTSHLPFEQNVQTTRQIVEKAHSCGVAVEAELGLLKGIEDDMTVSAQEAILTDPAQAEEFVRRTGCDSLAVAIGTSHGAYKFSGKQRLHFDRLAEIQKRLPGFPLVLHGGSSVPTREVERINAAGGTLDVSASGVSEDELVRAIGFGIAKVNIGTDGRLIWTRVHREFFREKPKEFDFMSPGRSYMDAYAEFVAAKCEKLGAARRARSRGETSLGSTERSPKSHLLIRPQSAEGEYVRVTPATAGWEHLHFAARKMRQGQNWHGHTGNSEYGFVILGGTCVVKSSRGAWENVGRRPDVFHGMPYALYLPPETEFTVTTLSAELDLAFGWCRAEAGHAPRLVTPAQVQIETRGGENATRQINSLFPPGFDCHRLVAVEVYTPSGNWSSYPPHKHDVHRTNAAGELVEADLEETYFYKMNRAEGYAMQRVYTSDGRLNEMIVAQHNDVVLVPEGYHPVVSAHGYTTYYLNFLAGSAQSLANSDDPDHAWVKQTWTTKDPRVPVVTLEMERETRK